MRVLNISTVTILALISSSVRADGLLYQLPDDGTWVRFELAMTAEIEGIQIKGAGSLTMQSVGRIQVDSEFCRWIEVHIEVEHEETKTTSIEKLLIPEKYLVKGEDPCAHAIKRWFKQDQTDPEEVEPPIYGISAPFLCDPLNDSVYLAKEVVESKLGKRECDGLTGWREFTEGELVSTVRYEIRLHERAPFGVVSARLETTTKEREPVEKGTLILNLSGWGKDAKTALPGYN